MFPGTIDFVPKIRLYDLQLFEKTQVIIGVLQEEVSIFSCQGPPGFAQRRLSVIKGSYYPKTNKIPIWGIANYLFLRSIEQSKYRR